MGRTSLFAATLLVAACGDSNRGQAEYDDGVEVVRDGVETAWSGVARLEVDIESADGRAEIGAGLHEIHRGTDLLQRGLEIMDEEWHHTSTCHGHARDIVDPLDDDLALLDEAHDGMTDHNPSDDEDHLERFDDALHEFEHHVDRMELRMECRRHHE